MRHQLLVLATASALAASASFTAANAQVSFLDHRSERIELESPPKRLVSILRDAPFIYRAVDETGEHIVGTNKTTIDKVKAGIYADLIPELLEISTAVAGDHFAPNVEAVLELQPDLVIQWARDPELYEPLERVGLKVAAWDCCTEEQRRDYLRQSGYISGRIDRAQTMLKMQDDSNEALSETFASIPEAERVSILEVDQLQDQIRVIANPSRNYALSGIRNIASDDSGEWWRTIDAEQFLVWNPQVIVIFVFQDDVLRPSDFYEHPLLKTVDAIKNKRVYLVPKFNVSPDAPEVYLTAEWLARVAHPEAFEGAKNFRDITRDAYCEVYGVDLTDGQLDAVLQTEANKDSAAYGGMSG